MKSVKIGVEGHLSRLILVVLAVVLGVGFAAGAFFARASVDESVSSLIKTVVSADVYVKPQGSSVADLLMKPPSQQQFFDSAITGQVAVVTGAAIYAIYLGPVVLEGPDGQVVSSGRAPAIGIAADVNEVGQGRLIEGEFPISVKEIALEENTAARAGLKIGDPVKFVANGNQYADEVTVSGIVSYDAQLNGAVVVILNGIVARAIFSPPGTVPLLAVKAEGMTAEQLVDAIVSSVDPDFNAEVVLGSQERQTATNQINASFGYLNIILVLIGVAALVAAGFMVINVFSTAIRSQSKEIAQLKVMGVTSGQVMIAVITQAAILGAIGSVVGIILGFVLVVIAKGVINGTGLTLVVGWPFLGLLLSIVIGVALTVLAAIIGAASAASVKATQAVKEPIAPRMTMGIVRVVIGLVIGVVGAVAVILGLVGPNDVMMILAGAAAILVGAVLAGPLAMVVLSPVFAAPMRLFSPLTAQVAKGGITQNPRRAANATGVFILFTAVATALLVLAPSAGGAIENKLSSEIQTDFVLTPSADNGFIADMAAANVRQIPGTQVNAFGQAPLTVDASNTGGSGAALPAATVMYGPPESFTNIMGTKIVKGRADTFMDGLAVNKAYADANGLDLGKTISFIVAKNTPIEKKVNLNINLIIDSEFFPDMVVSSSWLNQEVDGHTRAQFMPVTVLLVTITDTTIEDTAFDQIVTKVSPYHSVTVQTRQEFVSVTDPRVTQVQAAAYAIAGVGLVLGIVALVSALGIGVSRRGPDVAMLKALGATRPQ
ncbi:MAG: hypothetical protein FWD55_01025, partial [Propionibacteriaceae bacterium]|nr:hypothetical protein [Propionibacteriaceae bacterium]